MSIAVCLCTERVYVERPIFDAFVSRPKVAAQSLRPGRPEEEGTSLDPLISREHREKVLRYFEIAREDGATVVTGSAVPELGDDLAGGAWFEPTIWTGFPEDSRVVRKEIFGPCCHIQPFDNEVEAVR